MPDLSQAANCLREVFGLSDFRSQQPQAIQRVLNGHDCLVVMPTGGGKSLCYQIPAVMMPGTTLVISPLIALMQDQVKRLSDKGIAAAYLNSSLAPAETQQVLQNLKQQQLDLLYLAPERLVQPVFLKHIANININLIAVDEAHCISQWGHDFRKDYTALGEFRHHLPEVPLIALTATADPKTQSDIKRQLAIQTPTISGSCYRPNLHYRLLPRQNPIRQIATIARRYRGSSGIVYCHSRAKAEQVCQRVKNLGYRAVAYHAGQSSAVRQQVLDDFLTNRIDLVIATVAFGMGIDKGDVRFVIHHDLPKNLEQFYQQAGRAGRDGQTAEVVALIAPEDIALQAGFLDTTQDHPKFEALRRFIFSRQCRQQFLSDYFDGQAIPPCGRCDRCNTPSQGLDATILAQKILSCIYRLNQYFGSNYVIDVLKGMTKQRLSANRHHQLSTFGIAKHHSRYELAMMIEQLIATGFLVRDYQCHQVLRLTAAAKLLFKRDISLLYYPLQTEKVKSKTLCI